MFRNKFPHRTFALAAVVASVVAFTPTPPAQAGCGCSKPPPPVASVRPNVTYGGMPVTLFGSGITTGQLYNVTFTAMNGTTTTVSSVQAVSKRDLADATYKSQLVAPVPSSLPLGPVGITVNLSLYLSFGMHEVAVRPGRVTCWREETSDDH